MKDKFLSIITICKNDQAGLRKTLTSLEAQNHYNFEVIVVDGGSHDGSVDVIRNSPVVSSWVSENDTGIFNAQNKGVGMAKGEYCLFLNSGDYLASDDVVEKFQRTQTEAGVVFGDMVVESEGKKILKKSPLRITQLHLLKDTVWHPVSFIRKNLFSRYGNYDERFRIVADYEFFVRLFMRKVNFQHIDLTVSVFNTSGVSSSPAHRKQLEEERRKVQDMYFNSVLLYFFRLYAKMRN